MRRLIFLTTLLFNQALVNPAW